MLNPSVLGPRERDHWPLRADNPLEKLTAPAITEAEQASSIMQSNTDNTPDSFFILFSKTKERYEPLSLPD